jgi:hypothetical protein
MNVKTTLFNENLFLEPYLIEYKLDATHAQRTPHTPHTHNITPHISAQKLYAECTGHEGHQGNGKIP